MGTTVLVLNQDYQALSVCSVERAFLLVLLDKAELVNDVPDRVLKSSVSQYPYPSIIRLYRYINIPYKNVSLTRQNIYKRDGYQCVYCETKEDLTLDHLLPRSRGGKDQWINLVTACQKCNTYKGNRTPEEAAMVIRNKPYRPSFIMYLRDFSGKLYDEWKPYLMAN